MLTVTIKAQGLDETAKILDKYKHLLPQAVVRGTEAVALMHARYTINKKLTKANPPYLNQQTGALALSVAMSIHKERATLVGEKVTATYGTEKDYGAKHESGGTFTEKVEAHIRKIATRDAFARGKLLAVGVSFVKTHRRVNKKTGKVTESVKQHTRKVESRNVYAKGKRLAVGIAFVKEHTRTRTYRARRMFASSVEDLSAKAAIPLDKSINILLTQLRLATQNEMLAGTPGQEPARIRR